MDTSDRDSTGVCVYCGKFLSVHLIDTQDGLRQREVVRKKNAAAFLIYEPIRNAIILVSQVREPMITAENPAGLITEAPAGHLESNNIAAEIAREASEELGATIQENQLFLINKSALLAVSPGWTTEQMALGYVRLRPGQLEEGERQFGLAAEGENIKRKFISVSDLSSMVFEDLKTFALVQWFLNNIKTQTKEAAC